MTRESSGDSLTDAVKVCVNCGAQASGAYCSACGQESDVRLPTLRQFMRDATGSLVALDGRLWRTLRVLLTRPGFLTQEYFRGRRKYCVRPARLEHFNRLPAREKGKQLSTGLLPYGPYAMLVLLPVFAWLWQISCLGRLRPYPGRPTRYVEHLVYATHLHSVMFIAAIVATLMPFTWLRWAILIWLVVYIQRSKHAIYGGSRWGGPARSLFVAACYTVFMACALVLLLFPAILLA